jgi:hypothetical protein
LNQHFGSVVEEVYSILPFSDRGNLMGQYSGSFSLYLAAGRSMRKYP